MGMYQVVHRSLANISKELEATKVSVSRAMVQEIMVRGWGQGGEMTQALYAHMNNKTIKKRKKLWYI
jgi:signal transduction histidine kinase